MSILASYFSDTSLFVWLALFPLAYSLHVIEEHFVGDGYSAYLFNNYAVELSPARFLGLHCLGLGLMTLSIFLAINLKFPRTLLVILASAVLVDTATHILRRIRNRQHEPGLFTAIGVWVPLGVVTLISIWGDMSVARFFIALAIGAIVRGVVEIIALRGGRLLMSDML